MKFTQIPTDTFEKLQLNAGILCSGFAPATGAVTGIIGATTGGISFSDSPEFKDFGEDIDNCPKNTKELKKIDDRTVTMTGTFLTVSPATVKLLAGAADIGSTDTTKITPRVDLTDDDFDDIWFVGDYSDKNGATNGGYVAIHMLNALSTGGFSMQTTDKEKGQFAFEFTGHYSIEAIDTVPYEVYVKAGTAEPTT
jgi:hypothetical protein